ncbi:hypothetical protein B0H13DRAFT_1868710 [Mycena leptocephala]|nr:hypothetical protein B0H13DRAFT_1868710 [Mycena leptocephala]
MQLLLEHSWLTITVELGIFGKKGSDSRIEHSPLVSDESSLKASLAFTSTTSTRCSFFQLTRSSQLALDSEGRYSDLKPRPHPLQISYDYNFTGISWPTRLALSVFHSGDRHYYFKPLFLRLIAWIHYSLASRANFETPKLHAHTSGHSSASTFALEVLKYQIIVEISVFALSRPFLFKSYANLMVGLWYYKCILTSTFALDHCTLPKSQIIPRLSLKSQRSLHQIIDGRIAKTWMLGSFVFAQSLGAQINGIPGGCAHRRQRGTLIGV